MIGLIFSQVIMFAAAGLIGFAAGWGLHAQAAAVHARAAEADLEALRMAVADARVRRAARGA